MKKVPKATRIRRLKKALDRAWSEAVRKRDKVCQMPGCKVVGTLHSHHWAYPKSRSIANRWSLSNGCALHYSCHLFDVHRLSTYNILGPFFAHMVAKVGQPAIDNMALRDKTRWDYTEEELQCLLDGLNAN